MIHEVNTRTFNIKEEIMLTNRPGAPPRRKLEQLKLSKKSLYWSLQIDGNKINHLYSHILPSEQIAVTQFGWRNHIPENERSTYYIDIINVTEHTDTQWHMRDLYLDIEIFQNRHAIILDTDEYLAAIKASYLDEYEANQALETMHSVLNKLALFNYNLEAYLDSIDIHLTWEKV